MEKIRESIRLRKAAAFSASIFILWLTGLLAIIYIIGAANGHLPSLEVLVARWDGGWYSSIIEHGYGSGVNAQNTAFFPLYPLLVWLLTHVVPDIAIAGSLVSGASLLGGLIISYLLVQRRFGDDLARISVALLLFSPFSFFFIMNYSESLFLLLSVATLYFIDSKKFLLASLAAAFGSSVRVFGVLLAVVTCVGYLKSKGISRNSLLKAFGLGIIGCGGLLAYMLYLYVHVGDPLSFVHSAQKYWPERRLSIDNLKAPIHILRHNNPGSADYLLVLAELGALLVSLAAGLFAAIKIDLAWGALSVLSVLLAVSSGSLVSMNRYTIVLFPTYVAAAVLLGSKRYIYWFALSTVMLASFFSLYAFTMMFLG